MRKESFGSLAEGRAVPGSDADVLVLLSHSETRWLDRPLTAARIPLARRALERGVDLLREQA